MRVESHVWRFARVFLGAKRRRHANQAIDAEKKMIAFWLMPAAPVREFFDRLTRDFAVRFDAPRFEPHVTLCGGQIDEGLATEILRNLAPRFPISLAVEQIEWSDSYTKTLFVQFLSSPEIEALSEEIRTAISRDYELNPHLSLLYKQMPAAGKAEAARTVTLPWTHVTFDAVQVISTPHPITTREQVEAWRTLGSRPLAELP